MTPIAGNQFIGTVDAALLRTPAATVRPDAKAAARTNAENFEATFLNSMFQHMFTQTDGDGPVGGSAGIGVWRSFLTDEFAKSFAKKGGIGLADQVYQSLLAHQEVAPQQ
jgi:Rod binding domain-containing protein